MSAAATGATGAERSLPGAEALGAEAIELCERLFPIPRSITGDGVRETFRLLGDVLPLEVTEVRSGTPVLDWNVPDEWRLGEAWIADAEGNRIVDAAHTPLHVLGYSEGVDARLTGAELQEHLYSVPDQPGAVPMRTSYWERRWGFCLTDDVRRTISDEAVYHARIDADHFAGSLTYAESIIPGQGEGEVLISTYTCHPCLANDGVSGMAAAALLGKYLRLAGLRHTVRVLFAPATIGAITWLARNQESLPGLRAGLILSCVGDVAPLDYQRSRNGAAPVDRAAALVVPERGGLLRPFEPWGGDERHFCSPGFDLPVGHMTRSAHGAYAEYHTSGDDLSLLDPDSLAGSIAAAAAILDIVDANRVFVNLFPYGEPQLGSRGLYPTVGEGVPGESDLRARLWVLNLSDGDHSLVDIAERSGVGFSTVHRAAVALAAAGLLSEAEVR